MIRIFPSFRKDCVAIRGKAVIPAKFPMPCLGAWHPRMDENSIHSPPPLRGEGEGGGDFCSPSPSSPPARGGEMFEVFSNEAGIEVLQIVVVSNCLDARFRWHGELRHSLARGLDCSIPREGG